MPEPDREALQDLIIVAGHAAFKKTLKIVPEDPSSDEYWVLQKFQIGEPIFYIEHIRRGSILAANNPAVLLVFSGGRTRKEGGDWSEATTYLRVAEHYNWWIPEIKSELRTRVAEQTTIEEFAKDSFENLLFSICRFQQHTGHYPRNVTIVSWAFKMARFELHRAAIAFPPGRFRFDGFNDPIDLKEAQRGEASALQGFIESWYGSDGMLGEKKVKRNPFGQQHPYGACPGLQDFFTFIEKPENRQRSFTNILPWED